MAFFRDPGEMFLGCLGTAEQRFLVTLIHTAAKSGYTRFVEPCAGTFAMANLAVRNGFKPEQIETSDVSMMTSVLGYAITDQSLAPLEIHAQGFSDEELLDPATGYPIQERSGVIRYFIRHSEKIEWGNSREELYEKFDLRTEKERIGVKSCTFIASNIEDNQILLEKDPAYMANLKSLALIDRERLLKGNWKIKPAAGLYFKRSQIGAFLESIPDDVVTWCRCWDLAATESGENGSEPAATAGVLMGKRRNGRYLIADVVNVRLAAADVRKTIYNTCVMDRSRYGYVVTRLPQDPGQITGDHKKAVFSTEDYTLTTSLICGEYMNYESVIPKAGKYDVVFDRDSLLGAATRVKNLMDLKHREPVVLHIDGESCYITSRLTGVEFHEDVLCQGTIPEPMNIAFDDILLLNGISATKGEGIRALLNSSLSPMKIENEGFTALVLPVRMKNRA